MGMVSLIVLLLLTELWGAQSNPVVKRFLNYCPQFNFMCACPPKYENGCYICPLSCSSQGSSLFGNFHPGQTPVNVTTTSSLSNSGGGGSAVTQQTAAPNNLSISSSSSGSSGSSLDLVCPKLNSNCPQFMIKTDANGCPYCSGSDGPQSQNIDPAHQLNNCPPKDPSIPWSHCHIDRQGCILCNGQLVTTQSTTTTTTQSLSTSTTQSTTTSTTHSTTTSTTPSTTTSTTQSTTTTTTPSTTTYTTKPTTTAVTPPILATAASTAVSTSQLPTSVATTLTTTSNTSPLLKTSPPTTTSQRTTQLTTTIQPTTTTTTQQTTTTTSLWSAWYSGPCSVTCGRGNQTQIRRCNTGSDADCFGSPFRTVTCDLQDCPGHWLPYHNVAACSETCGDGFIVQRRECSTGKASDCQGRDFNEVPCHVRDC